MKYNKDISSIHAYLCSDGYVIKNPETQKHKYYYIGLRNYNTKLLKDFQSKCKRQFGIKPRIKKDGRAIIQNKNLYYELTNGMSFYSREWRIPVLNKTNLSSWLKSFFDCEAWVEVKKGKTRTIRLDSVNKEGVIQIQKALINFRINSTLKNRKNSQVRLNICGLDDLKKFQKHINFFHPKKDKLLQEAIKSYVTYEWEIPKTKDELIKFINKTGKIRKPHQVRLFTIKKKNLVNLKKALKRYRIRSKLNGPYTNQYGSLNYYLSLSYLDYKKLGGNKWK